MALRRSAARPALLFAALLCCVLPAVAIDNGVALTPPMGWNSWNTFRCEVSEDLIKQTANAIVEHGLDKVGWQYVNVDDCWQGGRDENGNIFADPKRFPGGMKALADYIHNKGLKFGIYSDAGNMTCAGFMGSFGYEEQDARTYAEWGVDFLKYDWCYMTVPHPFDPPIKAYTRMHKALNKTGRPIVYSLCSWGQGRPHFWGKFIANMWRTGPDLFATWYVFSTVCSNLCANASAGRADASLPKPFRDFPEQMDLDLPLGYSSVMEAVVTQTDYWKDAGPGGWNDPDMLLVGIPGQTVPEYHGTDRANSTVGGLGLLEQYTHFSFWAMMASPLIAGNDLRSIDENTLRIYTAKEELKVIAVNQDLLGVQGQKVWEDAYRQIWRKPLADGRYAFLGVNLGKSTTDVTFLWRRDSPYNCQDLTAEVRDLWAEKDLGTWATSYTATNLKPRESRLLAVRFMGTVDDKGKSKGSGSIAWMLAITNMLTLLLLALTIWRFTRAGGPLIKPKYKHVSDSNAEHA
eukprot:jgi/Chlat1/901/Chrsp107S01326